MAREPSVQEDDRTATSHDRDVDSDGTSGLLHRRAYLTLAGTAAAGTALGAATGAVAAESYDVVEVPAGEREVVRVGSGETFENVLFDITASGAAVTIAAYGTGWSLRNIGIKGRYSANQAVIGAADTGGGSSTIENVYIGDGAEAGHRVGLGIWVSPDHNGHLDIERVNIQEMGDNSFYCSAPGGQGTVDIRNCYSANSWVSHFRLARGTVENCVALNDERHQDGRGVWAWAPGTVEVSGCDLEMNGRHYAIVAGANTPGAVVTVEDTQWDDSFNGGYRDNNGQIQWGSGNGNSPDGSRVPEGCPTTPEEAAAGTEGSSDRTDRADEEDVESERERSLPHAVRFEGSDEGVTRYEFEVDGEVEPSTDEDSTIDASTEIEGGVVHGVVANWKDAFRFDGELTQLTLDGPARVFVDGEEIDPDDVGVALPHTLAVEGGGEPASYEITVDGTIEVDGDDDPEADVTVVSGTTVQSSNATSTQRFRFSGALTDVTFTDGDATVLVDGEEIDPDAYGEELLPHALLIDGTEASGPSTYAVRVDGRVARPTFSGPSAHEDVIEGRAVRGVVSDWLEVYWFDGELTDCTVLGDAAVSIQYNAREQ